MHGNMESWSKELFRLQQARAGVILEQLGIPDKPYAAPTRLEAAKTVRALSRLVDIEQVCSLLVSRIGIIGSRRSC
jgi:hypothetical protein